MFVDYFVQVVYMSSYCKQVEYIFVGDIFVDYMLWLGYYKFGFEQVVVDNFGNNFVDCSYNQRIWLEQLFFEEFGVFEIMKKNICSLIKQKLMICFEIVFKMFERMLNKQKYFLEFVDFVVYSS